MRGGGLGETALNGKFYTDGNKFGSDIMSLWLRHSRGTATLAATVEGKIMFRIEDKFWPVASAVTRSLLLFNARRKNKFRI